MPLRGQFEAAFRLKPAGAPPLSVENTITLFSSIFFFRKASTTRPTDSSSLLSMPENKETILYRTIFLKLWDGRNISFFSLLRTRGKRKLISLHSAIEARWKIRVRKILFLLQNNLNRRNFREISVVTGKASTVVVEDIGELGDVLVGCRQRVVRISGVDCGVGQVEEHRPTGVVIVDQFHSLLREDIRGILAVEVPSWLQSSPHVQSPIRLHLSRKEFLSRTDQHCVAITI